MLPQRAAGSTRRDSCEVAHLRRVRQYIAEKAGISQPAASKHMELLVAAGAVIATPIGRWVFYRRDDAGLAASAARITRSLTEGQPDA